MANEQKKSGRTEPGITRTIRSDFRQTKIKEEFKTEYSNLKQSFLDEERKKKLGKMNPVKRFFVLPWWLLKASYYRLTPFRRLLLVVALIFLFLSGNSQVSDSAVTFNLNLEAVLAGMILLFILALELKDKLLAKTELEEGRAIQQALMPERSPKITGWDIWLYTRSANDVGGDLLDFIQLEKNKFGVAVGDVAGKGLSAALLMAKLQSSIRALVYDHQSLPALGRKLNKIFHRDSLPKIFASMIYAEFSNESGEVKFINAGHFPPIMLKDKKVEQLEKDAPALGLVPDADFHEQIAILNKNDYMIIYSDGLTESRNENGEFFGEERFIELLKNSTITSAQQLGEIILFGVDKFVGKNPAHDDLTLAILKKTV